MTTLTKTLSLGSAVAATAIGFTLATAPAQAASILGLVGTAGPGELIINPDNSSTFNFDINPFITGSTGIFEGATSVTMSATNFTPTGMYSGVTNFMSFNNGVTFNLDPGQVEKYNLNDSNDNSPIVEDFFTGTFLAGSTQLPGSGGFSINSTSGMDNFSLTAKAVPEPMTILGSAAALGFGALFKKRSQKA